MRKKGDIIVEPIALMTIALFVLAIVGFGFYLYFTGALNFFKFLPDFGRTNKSITQGGEILRYDILNDKLSYYDGVKWIDFRENENFNLGDKELGYGWVHSDFLDYYYNPTGLKTIIPDSNVGVLTDAGNREVPDNIILYDGDNGLIQKMYAKSGVIFLPTLGAIIQGIDIPTGTKKIGGVRVALVHAHVAKGNYENIPPLEDGVYGTVLVKPDDVVMFTIEDSKNYDSFEVVDSSQGDFKVIREKTVSWRDSVLNSPMIVRTNNKGDISACVRKDRNIYLIVDLSVPSEDCESG